MPRRFVFVLLLLVALTLPAAASPLPQSSRLVTVPARISELAAQGAAPVIVNLAVPVQPVGLLPADAAAAQQAALRQAQDAVLVSVDPAHRTNVKPFRYVAAMAMTVDAAGLRELQAAPGIVSIVEDAIAAPTLNESNAIIGAPAAWASGFTGSGQTVAVLDTGVDAAHPFFGGRVVSEACYSTTVTTQDYSSITVCPNGQASQIGPGAGEDCAVDVAGCDHGTHVAGIVAGKSPTLSGVAPQASLIAIQVFSRFNNYPAGCGANPCVLTFNSDQISGLERVYDLRTTYSIAAVNMSLGGGSYTSHCDASETARKQAIDNLASVGIATIIASGNNGYSTSIGAPACISTAIAVGSTTDTVPEQVSSFSNSATIVDLLAPGQVIYSSIPGGGYGNKQGTSMATPNVAGAWAVMRSKKPTATINEILSAFASTGFPVNDGRTGIIKPRIKLDSALTTLVVGPMNFKAYVPMVRRATAAPPPSPLLNGSFEQGRVAWAESSSNNHALIVTGSGSPRTGSWLAWLGGDDDETSTLAQNVTLGANPGYLIYYYWISGQETLCGWDDAIFSVNGSQLRFYDLCTPNATNGWVRESISLAPYANQSVQLWFGVDTDGSSPSNFFIDDVSISPTP